MLKVSGSGFGFERKKGRKKERKKNGERKKKTYSKKQEMNKPGVRHGGKMYLPTHPVAVFLSRQDYIQSEGWGGGGGGG